MKEHWYKITIHYCPLCGKEDKYRERIYGEKPKDHNERYVIKEYWDYCDY